MGENARRNQACPCGSGTKYKHCCGATVSVPGSEMGPGSTDKYGRVVKERDKEYLHIVMPTRGSVCLETMLAIGAVGWGASDYARLGVSRATFTAMPRLPVAKARENLADAVIRGMEVQPDVKHWVLWVDDDSMPTFNDMVCLLAEIRRNEDIGIMSCYYAPKGSRNHPGWVPAFGTNENFLLTPGVDYSPTDIVEVPWVGLHCAVMRGEILPKLERPRFPCDPVTGVGEDVGFSHRIIDAGYKCAVHCGVPVAHIDALTGESFVPDTGSRRIRPPTSDEVKEIVA